MGLGVCSVWAGPHPDCEVSRVVCLGDNKQVLVLPPGSPIAAPSGVASLQLGHFPRGVPCQVGLEGPPGQRPWSSRLSAEILLVPPFSSAWSVSRLRPVFLSLLGHFLTA